MNFMRNLKYFPSFSLSPSWPEGDLSIKRRWRTDLRIFTPIRFVNVWNLWWFYFIRRFAFNFFWQFTELVAPLLIAMFNYASQNFTYSLATSSSWGLNLWDHSMDQMEVVLMEQRGLNFFGIVRSNILRRSIEKIKNSRSASSHGY